MTGAPSERFLADEAATTLLGEDLAAALRPGDVVALHGDLGAGKSTLARGLIRALAGDRNLDVPSPTFTLVQVYEARFPIHHFDLYRLGSPDEVDELGLDDAIQNGIALVEWPERAEGRLPRDAISLTLSERDGGRIATIEGPGEKMERIGRSLALREFLKASGWGSATRTHLVGDASARSYETVDLDGLETRILMNAPPLVLGPPVRDGKAYAEIARSARSVHAFVGVAALLRQRGIAVPDIHASNLEAGFLLIEHLGSGSFLAEDGQPLRERYAAAAELLAFMHEAPWTDRAPVAQGFEHIVPPFDRAAMSIETELLLDWYLPWKTREKAGEALRSRFSALWNEAFDRLDGKEQSIVLRDFHSPNIIWRGQKTGRERLGIIDFQDALIGPAAYDVASLAMDARVTIPAEIEQATVDAYAHARQKQGAFDAEAFAEAYAIMAAQRNSKILGIFVRLSERDGKPQYLKHLPRIRDYLRRALSHPALAGIRAFYDELGLIAEPVDA